MIPFFPEKKRLKIIVISGMSLPYSIQAKNYSEVGKLMDFLNGDKVPNSDSGTVHVLVVYKAHKMFGSVALGVAILSNHEDFEYL